MKWEAEINQIVKEKEAEAVSEKRKRGRPKKIREEMNETSSMLKRQKVDLHRANGNASRSPNIFFSKS